MWQEIRISLAIALGMGLSVLFIEFLGFMEPGAADKIYFYPVCFGSYVLLTLLTLSIEQLIVYSIKSKTTKENLRFRKWQNKVDEFWLEDCFLSIGRKPLITRENYQKCCELIDKLCKDKLVSIDNKKVLYESLCLMWTNYGMDEGIYQIPIFIQEKWKKAQVDDKLRQLKKDF